MGGRELTNNDQSIDGANGTNARPDVPRSGTLAEMIQRKLKIGYNRAARIMDDLEERGIVGPDNGNAAQGREILVDLDSMLEG